MNVARVVNTRYWEDEKVQEEFSQEDKLFMLYLLTNTHTTQLGVYRILYKQMSDELGYPIEKIKTLMERFENEYKNIRYSKETREIAIKNYLCYSILSGGKPVFDLLVRESKRVQDKSLLEYILDGASKSDNKTVKQFCNYLVNDNEKQNDNDNDKHNDNDNDNVNDNDNDNDKSYHERSTNGGRAVNESSTNRKEIPIYSDYVRRADS